MSLTSSSSANALDDIYRYQRYIYDATRAYYLFGRDRLIEQLDVPAGGTVLEIGCGTARNLIHVAQRYPTSLLLGVDVSNIMLETAMKSIGRKKLDQHIRLANADAVTFDPHKLFGQHNIDRMFFSYTLSMIPSWRNALINAAGYLKPGTSLHIIDFGDFAAYPSIFRIIQLAWLKRFHVTPIPDFELEIKKLGNELGCEVSLEHLYGGYAIHAKLTRR